MSAINDETILKLHTAENGEIWYADGVHAPCNSGLLLRGFMESLQRPQSVVRVLGLAANAPLITALYNHCGHNKIARLEVAGPRVCETAAERRDPAIVLYRMRQCLLPAALGGWHIMAEHDYPSYAIAAHLQMLGELDLPTALHYLSPHPAWRDLQFVQGVNPIAAAKLLAVIRDPRWYINAKRPERTNALRLYLGLTPRIQQAVSAEDQRLENVQELHCQLVRDVWRSGNPPSDADCERPAQFLWRVWRSAGGGWRGDLRASQVLLLYLWYTWLDALARCNRQRGDLFPLERVFKTAAEVDAYKAHRGAVPGVV